MAINAGQRTAKAEITSISKPTPTRGMPVFYSQMGSTMPFAYFPVGQGSFNKFGQSSYADPAPMKGQPPPEAFALKFTPSAYEESFGDVDANGSNMNFGGGYPIAPVSRVYDFYGKSIQAVAKMEKTDKDARAEVIMSNESNGTTSNTSTDTETVSFDTFYKAVRKQVKVSRTSLKTWLQSINLLTIEKRRLPSLVGQAVARFKFPNRMQGIEEIGQP